MHGRKVKEPKMTLTLRANRTCPRRRQLQSMLHLLGVPYSIDLASQDVIKPALYVDEDLVVEGLPTMRQLMTVLSPYRSFSRAF